MTELTEFTYQATLAKIRDLKPKQLFTLCDDLMASIAEHSNNNHTVYALRAFSVAYNRLAGISSMRVRKKTLSDYNHHLTRYRTFASSTVPYDLCQLSLNRTIYWFIYSIDELRIVNNALAGQPANAANSMRVETDFRILGQLGSLNTRLVEHKLITNLLGPDAPILNFIPEPFLVKTELENFSVSDNQMILDAIVELKADHNLN